MFANMDESQTSGSFRPARVRCPNKSYKLLKAILRNMQSPSSENIYPLVVYLRDDLFL
jgi:hypothetical protein